MGFALTSPVDIERLIAALRKDKKSAGDQIRIVLPTAIGRCEVRSVMFDWLDERLRQIMK
jgi:3-dehydroquinate synthetase